MWFVRSSYFSVSIGLFTCFLTLFSQWAIVTIILLPWMGLHSIHIPIYSLFTILSLISHWRTQFIDPGSVRFFIDQLDFPSTLPAMPHCRHCGTLKTESIHHCSTSRRCIVRLDHWCPWVSNCIGVRNQKNFLLFLFFTLALCIHAGILLALRFFSCTSNPARCTISGWHSLFALLNFLESLIFGLFISIMIFDQFTAIAENNSTIQQLKGRKSRPIGLWKSLENVFGEPFCVRWLLPIEPPAFRDKEFIKKLAGIQ